MRCKHPQCSCESPPGQTYCSPHCERHAEDKSERCGCGHPNCRGK